MKFSEAIRKGAAMRPAQAFYVLFDRATNGTCAIGAAADAIGLLDTTHYNRFLDGQKPPQDWRWIRDRVATCPACAADSRMWVEFDTIPTILTVQPVIRHLNNEHRWTREQIADWVAVIEADEESLAAGAVDPSVSDSGTPTPRAAECSSSSSSVSSIECGGTVSR